MAAPLGGGGDILLPAQHLGLLALSQGQGLVCTEHTAFKANRLEIGWRDRAWKLQVLGVEDKIKCHSLKATYHNKLQSSIHKQESKNLVERGKKKTPELIFS